MPVLISYSKFLAWSSHHSENSLNEVMTAAFSSPILDSRPDIRSITLLIGVVEDAEQPSATHETIATVFIAASERKIERQRTELGNTGLSSIVVATIIPMTNNKLG